MQDNVKYSKFFPGVTKTDVERICELNNSGALQGVDWKESPQSVLESVDLLLNPFGLEVVIFDTGSDEYDFLITPKTHSKIHADVKFLHDRIDAYREEVVGLQRMIKAMVYAGESLSKDGRFRIPRNALDKCNIGTLSQWGDLMTGDIVFEIDRGVTMTTALHIIAAIALAPIALVAGVAALQAVEYVVFGVEFGRKG
jgi:hypothetical protein